MKDKILLKSILNICIIILLAGCITSTGFVVKEYDVLSEPKTVALLDFVNKTKYGQRRLSDSAAEILTSELSRSGNFIIVERERLDKILEELELQMSDMTDDTKTAGIGKILNCEYLISGVISNFGVKTEGRDLLIVKQKFQIATSEVDVKIIEVETARIVYSAYGKGVAKKKVGSAFGLGGTGGYDETLAGECLRAAISDAVEKMIAFFQK